MTTVRGQRTRLLGLIVFVLACAAVFLELLNLAGGLHLGATYNFQTVVPDAQQLVPNSDVRDAGVDIGRVTSITTTGTNAIVSVAINKGDAPIYRNATLQVRTKTLVGESYLDLNPGTPNSGAIPDGGTLPLTQAKDSVQLDQILSTLTPTRRARLQTLLTGLGGGLANSSQNLNDTVAALSSAVDNAAPVAQTLAAQHDQIPILVSDLGQVFTALGKQSTGLRSLITNGLGAANAVADQQAALTAGLRALPATLTTARDTVGHLATVGTSATPVLDQLTTDLNQLDPALQYLPGAGRATLDALHRLHAATPHVLQLLAALKATAPTLTQMIPPLDAVLRQARPAIAYLAPYALDLGSLFAGLDGEGDNHDATGEYARVVEVLGPSPIVGLTSEQQALLTQLTKVGAVQLLAKKGLNAYPAPNTAANPQQMLSRYPRIQQDFAPRSSR